MMEGWLQEADLNRRPLGYEPNELPGCSILQSPDYPNPQSFSTLTARRGTAYFQGANSMSATTILTDAAVDGTKLLEAIPALTSAYTAVQSTLTADQHVAVLQKVTDLVSAVTPSVTAAADAGLIGKTDASHAVTIADAITTGVAQASFWEKVVAAVRSWF
jgi:hypothetical protein